MVFPSKKPQYVYNFHDDELLHDQTPEPGAWNSNLAGDAVAAVKLVKTGIAKGFANGVKDAVGELDINDPLSRALSREMVSELWGSMLHPPMSYRGSEFQYRSPDGSNNNILFPDLGAARTPYAKTVQGKRALYGAKPDAGDLFDLLMARNEKPIESASGLSSMLLYHATIIIHDIFRTDDEDANLSATSSYLDLAPLYGSDLQSQIEVRQMTDGLLKPDTFSEKRLLNQPPGVCIYIIMYNRFHNYVAKQLLEINENGRFSLPADFPNLNLDAQKAARAKQDNDLFNTARLITCGLYIQIAIHDYLRCLMLMHTKDTAWTLDPRVSLPERNNKKGLQRGEGNMVSVEFNLLYRFHSPISKRDAWWAEDVFVQLLRDRGMVAETEADAGEYKFTKETIVNGEIPVPVIRHMLEKMKEHSKSVTPKQGSSPDAQSLKFFPEGLDIVGGFTKDPVTGIIDTDNKYRFNRGPDGKFDDAQLAAEIIRAMEDPICQFGANNIPKVFKSIEILGILQARKWEVATLNEFREFFNMSRHKHFEDINDDPQIQEKLRDLYEDPDLVELYPGLFCEGSGRCLDPGVACPGNESTALWRGVFSDAVTLVRSDRFYTLDWNIGSLTAWGMREVNSDPKVNKGSVMHNLFQRAFPGFFSYNSIHMWQPFYTPTANAQLAQEQGYLSFLDLSGLEDQHGEPWNIARRNGKVTTNFKTACKGTNGRKVRRKLKADLPDGWFDRDWQWQEQAATKIGDGKNEYPWRGAERANKVSKTLAEVNDYEVIKHSILNGTDSQDWIGPSILEVDDIPAGALREIMTKKWGRWEEATKAIQSALGPGYERSFMDYFVGLSQDMRLREQRKFQKFSKARSQVLQLDIVKDYAIPVTTRFVADFLGFWEEVKTPQFLDRPLSENQIYRHLENCQNYDSYNVDPTKTWERRMAFITSIKVLKSLAEKGVSGYEPRLFENGVLGFGTRVYGREGDGEYIREVRKIAVGIVHRLRGANFSHDEVVAVMLSTALDVARKIVCTFTEALAYFIDPERHDIDIPLQDERTKLWKEIQGLAWKDAKKISDNEIWWGNSDETDRKLAGYVLEAQRFNEYLRIPRIYQPQDLTVNSVRLQNGQVVKRGDFILLNLYEAYQNVPSTSSSVFPDPETFDPTRKLESYLVFGGKQAFKKQLALVALTGMIKHAAHLKELRVAHDKVGRLKRVMTPGGLTCYASVQWDRLLPAPTMWNLRFTGVGEGVFTDGDNADQGHGQDQVWQPIVTPIVSILGRRVSLGTAVTVPVKVGGPNLVDVKSTTVHVEHQEIVNGLEY